MPQSVLCEVFGYPVDNFSVEAKHYRDNKLCPYNNRIPECTKSKRNDPIGVCSIWEANTPAIICPVRFRQNWSIVSDIQPFLFPDIPQNQYKYVTEAKLADADEASVGNIDLVGLNVQNDQILDFAGCEIQAAYISGNVTNPFKQYYQNPLEFYNTAWTGGKYPRPDWLSSIKRLEHQLIMKGTLFGVWQKKMAVVIQNRFYNNFRSLQ